MIKDHPPQPTRRRYTVLTQLSSQAWEYPTDRASLNALRAVPGFDEVVRATGRRNTKRAWCSKPPHIVRFCRGYFECPLYVLLPFDVGEILTVGRLLPKQHLYVTGRR